MIINPSLPPRTVAEFIAFAKTNPGKISMASFDAGSTSHMAGELFKTMTGIELIHVPYRGSAPAFDIISGHVQVMFDVMTSSLPHIRLRDQLGLEARITNVPGRVLRQSQFLRSLSL